MLFRSGNNGNSDNSEDNKPIINIDININNENNSDNHSENNNDNNVDNHADNHYEDNSDNHTDVNVDNHSDNHSENNTENNINNDMNVENNVENNSDNHSENNINNDTNVDTHNDINNDNHTDVNNDTNVDNHNDNTTEVNNDNHTDVNNENNNQDENNVNIENNPTQTNDNNNDSSINNNPVNTNENNNDGSVENNSTNENQSNSENHNDNSSSSSSDNENQNISENNNENAINNSNTCTENCETTCEDDSCNKEEATPEPKKGIVVANYLDQDGKIIAASVITMDYVEEDYVTNQKDIQNYTFKNVEGEPIGKYIDGVYTVNYYYEEAKQEVVEEPKYGTVYTHYLDTKGNKISNDKVNTYKVGSEYTTIKETFEGYNYLTVINNTNGIVREGEIDVTYLYEIIPEEEPIVEPITEKENGTVVVYYIDTKGNTLVEKEVIEKEVGETYLTDQKPVEEYNFVTVVGAKNGTVQEGITEVIYIYEKQTTCGKEECSEKPVCPADDLCQTEEKNGTVVARYIDNEGNTLIEEIITERPVGENYVTEQFAFEGYDFVTVAGNRSGKYVDGVVEVTYVYKTQSKAPACPSEDACKPEEKTGKLIIHFIDEDGNTLLEDKESIGKVDEPYTSAKEEIENYTFKAVEGEENGTYKEGVIEITYIYTRNKGNVIAHYVDINGNMIGVDKTQEGYVGESYETKLRKFRGYTFVQVVGAYAGEYKNGTIEVTYIYEKTEEEGNTPVDEQGTTIQPSGTTIIETDNKEFYNSLRIPNTGIPKENNINLLALIMILLGMGGITILKINEE